MRAYAFDKVLSRNNDTGTKKLGDLGPLLHLAQTYPQLDASQKQELLSRYEITAKEMKTFHRVIDNINL